MASMPRGKLRWRVGYGAMADKTTAALRLIRLLQPKEVTMDRKTDHTVDHLLGYSVSGVP